MILQGGTYHRLEVIIVESCTPIDLSNIKVILRTNVLYLSPHER